MGTRLPPTHERGAGGCPYWLLTSQGDPHCLAEGRPRKCRLGGAWNMAENGSVLDGLWDGARKQGWEGPQGHISRSEEGAGT